jgi:hypothetical protein
VTLKPGPNVIPFNSISNQLVVIGYLTKNGGLTAVAPIKATLINSTFNGVDIPYYTKAFEGVVVPLNLNISAPNGINNVS